VKNVIEKWFVGTACVSGRPVSQHTQLIAIHDIRGQDFPRLDPRHLRLSAAKIHLSSADH